MIKIRYDRNYTMERMTEDEHNLSSSLPHTLSLEDHAKRMRLHEREMRTDVRWGFYGNTHFSAMKRVIYKTIVHRFLKKRDLPLVPIYSETDD